MLELINRVEMIPLASRNRAGSLHSTSTPHWSNNVNTNTLITSVSPTNNFFYNVHLFLYVQSSLSCVKWIQPEDWAQFTPQVFLKDFSRVLTEQKLHKLFKLNSFSPGRDYMHRTTSASEGAQRVRAVLLMYADVSRFLSLQPQTQLRNSKQ